MLAVANYHYIREDFTSKYPSIFGLTPTQFRKQLEKFSKIANFISQAGLLKFKNTPFDKNYLLITFDDGLKEQYELAKPILDAMGIPFIFFINTSNFQEKSVSLVHKIHLLRSRLSSHELLEELIEISGLQLSSEEKAMAISHYNYDEPETAFLKFQLNFKMNHLQQTKFIEPLFRQVFDDKKIASELYFDSEMLQALDRQDSLGAHSHHHVPLGRLTAAEVTSELKKSQEFFQNNFGKPAVSISYPYGSKNACSGILKQVRENKFQLGFTMERALNADLHEDSLLLSRFDCNDMPLGKNDLFKTTQLFQNPLLRKWYQDENSIINK